MATATNTVVDRQVSGLNACNIDDVVSVYADDATLVLVSPHTLPGEEMRLSGKEKITRHMQRVLDGGISNVAVQWVGEGDGFLAWRDTGNFGKGIPFSEAHTATLSAEGQVQEHWIHSVYSR